MAKYVAGFVLPVPKRNLPAYRRMAARAGRIWREHGALAFAECVGDDLKIKGVFSFLGLVKPKPGEAVLFSFIVFKSRAHRDRVNAKVARAVAIRPMRLRVLAVGSEFCNPSSAACNFS
ncbi:MAG: DUF1428 domain-containing protein [Chloroflexi bacterium]|nr:DUF1428 domain-containing protein [Chloroflexota bacterium]